MWRESQSGKRWTCTPKIIDLKDPHSHENGRRRHDDDDDDDNIFLAGHICCMNRQTIKKQWLTGTTNTEGLNPTPGCYNPKIPKKKYWGHDLHSCYCPGLGCWSVCKRYVWIRWCPLYSLCSNSKLSYREPSSAGWGGWRGNHGKVHVGWRSALESGSRVTLWLRAMHQIERQHLFTISWM